MENKREAIRRVAICAAAALILSAPRPSHAAASITIVNADAADRGLNDPTPVAPVGGNAGLTVGQQRFIAFSYAANIWGAALDASIGISISSSFPDLACTTTSGVLGAAGPRSVAMNLPPPARQNVWYVGALASQLAGQDVDQGNPSIQATFNAQVGTANCLPGTSWYYGLDGNTGPNQFDLADVVLHEFAHGLGFLSLAGPNGSWFPPSGQPQLPDIWEFTMLDLFSHKHWSDMTNDERSQSAIRPRQLVWDGTNARSAAPSFLVAGTPTLTVTSPPNLAREYLVGEAEFGPPLTNPGVAGILTAPLDSAGSTEGCSAFSSQLSGIVLLDRGDCTFVAKVKNAQAAGAIAVVIANIGTPTPPSPPPPMGGTDSTITIPSVLISQADGATLRNAIPQGVMVIERLLPTLRGADAQGNTMLYTPDQYTVGSSVSHTDQSALLLMDPMYNQRLFHKLDLTPYFLRDIGWSVSNPDPADQSADITLSVTGSKNYQKDTNVVCNVTVSNKGPSNARDVLLFATAPAGVTFASTMGSSCTGFPCSLGTMAAGTNRSFTVSFHVSPSYTDSNLKLTLNAAPPFTDPDASNNAGTVNSQRGSLGAGGCASTGLGEPTLLAALLLLAFLPRRSRSRA